MEYFTQWLKGVRGQLLLLAMISVGSYATLLSLSAYEFSQLGTAIENTSTVRIPLMFSAAEMDSSQNSVLRWLWTAYANADTQSRNNALTRVSTDVKNFESARQSYLKLPQDAKMTELFAPVNQIWSDVQSEISQVATSLAKNVRATDQIALGVLNEKIAPAFTRLDQAMDKLNGARIETNKADAERDLHRMNQMVTFIIVGGIITNICICIFIFFLGSRLANGLTAVTRKIGESSKKVTSASHQISSSSQELAEGTSQQASAVEETSASMEQVAAMVENNSRSAENSLKLATSVKTGTERGSQAMEQLRNSMAAILESNKKIEGLVKVIEVIRDKTAIIDEIVFQTKLLSFNASVEAERAGEHGRGFAVVAQEVGNLAQMSGKAALEISSIVKDSIKDAEALTAENHERVSAGAILVQETATILDEIQTNSETLLSGSSSIVSASKEQLIGIKQVNSAMENINKITQEAAGTSEETASAAKGLDDQANNLNRLVLQLSTYINGRDDSARG